jgi:hypothetical protein
MPAIKINDDLTCVEIAIIKSNNEVNFTKACREAILKCGTKNHSEDSTIRRLRKKFNRDKDKWYALAREEIQRRRIEQIKYVALGMYAGAAAMAVVAKTLIDEFRPQIEEVQRMLSSPELKTMLLETQRSYNKLQDNYRLM